MQLHSSATTTLFFPSPEHPPCDCHTRRLGILQSKHLEALIVNIGDKCLAKPATGQETLILSGVLDHNSIDHLNGVLLLRICVLFPSIVGILFWKSHYSRFL